jgi:hypothetical protein
VEGIGANWGLLEAPLDACSTAAAAGAAADVTSSSGVAATAAAPGSNHTDAAATAGGQNGGAAAAAAVAPTHIVVHRNFFVLQFLMQCLPVGCSYRPLKQLGKFGVLVQHSCKHAVLVLVNASEKKPRVLAVDARLWLEAAAAAAAAVGGTQAGQEACQPGYEHEESNRTPAAATAAAVGDHCVQVRVELLDLQALQSVQYNAAAGLSSSSPGSTVHEQQVVCSDWPLGVEVPPASLCKVELLA